VNLLGLAILFLVIGLVFFLLGARGAAGVSLEIGRLLLLVFAVLFIVSMIAYAVS